MYLKKPLQPSQVMALKWKPVALSPQTPQIRGTFLSNSSAATVDVLTTVGSITKKRDEIKGGKGETKRHSKQHCRNCMQQLTHTHTHKKKKKRKKRKIDTLAQQPAKDPGWCSYSGWGTWSVEFSTWICKICPMSEFLQKSAKDVAV